MSNRRVLMNKLSVLLCISVVTSSYGYYEEKEVEATQEKRPRSSHISVRRTQVFITNKTNHNIKNFKVIFKFSGRRSVLNNKLVFDDSVLGEVNVSLPRNKTMIVHPMAATNKNGQSPAHEFVKI